MIINTPSLEFFQFDTFTKLPATDFDYQGNNKQQILLIGKGISQPEQYEFLDKILAAIQLQRLEDCACVDVIAQPIAFASLLQRIKPKIGILFGVLPSELAWQVRLPLYEWVEWNSARWLLSHSLNDLQGAQQAYKKNLWNNLKLMKNEE